MDEEVVVKDLKESFGGLGQEIISSKIQQQHLFAQAAADGGPSSYNQALLQLMDATKIGVRAMSQAVGVKRKLFLAMLQGRTPMPPEISVKVYAVLKKKQPTLFNFDEIPVKPKKI